MDTDQFLKIEQELISKDYHGKLIKDISEVDFISGIDISYPKNENDLPSVAYSIHKLVNNETIALSGSQLKEQPKIPYKAGFLGHKEAEIMVPEVQNLHSKISKSNLNLNHNVLNKLVILVDGNGRFHPRKFGSACHIGYHIQFPTIGVAKNYLQVPGVIDKDNLQVRIEKELIEFGDYFKLSDDNEEIVAVVRTSKRTQQNPKCQPIYVSIGSGIENLDLAVQIVLSVSKFKIPEPVRQADKVSRMINLTQCICHENFGFTKACGKSEFKCGCKCREIIDEKIKSKDNYTFITNTD